MNSGPGSPPVVFFDVMGTLVRDPFFEDIPAFFGMSLTEFIRLKHPTAWLDFEHGDISEEEYLCRMFADGRTVDGGALVATIVNAYRWLDGMESLAAELHGRGIGLHTLSNYSVWYRYIEEKLALSRYLKWTFVSCDAGVRKPGREAFLGAAAAVGRAPEECLLIDDVRDNCVGAEAAGMPAIHFCGAAELRAELLRRGLL